MTAATVTINVVAVVQRVKTSAMVVEIYVVSVLPKKSVRTVASIAQIA